MEKVSQKTGSRARNGKTERGVHRPETRGVTDRKEYPYIMSSHRTPTQLHASTYVSHRKQIKKD